MSRVSAPYSNFSSGELGHEVRGRFDLDFFFAGVEFQKNFIALTQGPNRYRQGTRFVINTKNDNEAMITDFQFSDEQAYVLEFTNLLMRVMRDNAIIVETGTVITGITQANPAVVTDVGHPYANGEDVFISGVVGMVEINDTFYQIANITANTYHMVGIDSTGFTAYSSAGISERVFELVSPYTTAQLFELKFAQTADTMYITHPAVKPQKLTLSNLSFTPPVSCLCHPDTCSFSLNVKPNNSPLSFTAHTISGFPVFSVICFTPPLVIFCEIRFLFTFTKLSWKASNS